MRWHILAIGKPKLDFARLGIEEYAARLKPVAPVRVEYLKAGQRAEESRALLDRSDGMFRIVLDERGDHLASRELVKKIEAWEQRGPRDFALLIGGADGHTDELRKAALVVLLEQLYRAYTIKAGLPYHRD